MNQFELSATVKIQLPFWPQGTLGFSASEGHTLYTKLKGSSLKTCQFSSLSCPHRPFHFSFDVVVSWHLNAILAVGVTLLTTGALLKIQFLSSRAFKRGSCWRQKHVLTLWQLRQHLTIIHTFLPVSVLTYWTFSLPTATYFSRLYKTQSHKQIPLSLSLQTLKRV